MRKKNRFLFAAVILIFAPSSFAEEPVLPQNPAEIPAAPLSKAGSIPAPENRDAPTSAEFLAGANQSPLSVPSFLDSDGDKLSDLEEYLIETDPYLASGPLPVEKLVRLYERKAELFFWNEVKAQNHFLVPDRSPVDGGTQPDSMISSAGRLPDRPLPPPRNPRASRLIFFFPFPIGIILQYSLPCEIKKTVLRSFKTHSLRSQFAGEGVSGGRGGASFY